MKMTASRIDILSRLDAMQVQEESMRCHNYFRSNACIELNEECRQAMVTWLQQVQKTLSFSSETVWIAMSYFDRYLSSGKGESGRVLQSRRKFQLAAITAFYMAVKIYEPVVLGVDLLVEVCRGAYSESDIVSMESDILVALDWRVSVFTPLDFVRHLLELLPENKGNCCISECLLEGCQKQVDGAISNLYDSCLKPSVLGVRCLAKSLAASDGIFSSSEKRTIRSWLSELCSLGLFSTEVMGAQQRLPSLYPNHNKSSTASKKSTTLSRSRAVVAEAESSSPICVTRTARQA